MQLKGLYKLESFLFLLFAVLSVISEAVPKKKTHRISHRGIDNSLEIDFQNSNGDFVLAGNLGISLPLSVGDATGATCTGDFDECFDYGDFAHLDTLEGVDSCTRIEWKSTFARRLEDCYRIDPDVHWYGGNAAYNQRWPMEGQGHGEDGSVTKEFGSPTENYWLISSGVSIHVEEDVPLFTSLNTETGLFCLVAKDVHPFTQRTELVLKYDICVGNNIKDIHQKSMVKYYESPSGIPDQRMLISPFWSTWAQYKTSVNQSIVLEMARKVKSEGYELSSHIEIDDDWESCYGEATFNSEKFPDPAAMVEELRALDLRVTLWIHPFINIRCPSFTEAMDKSYFVQDQKSKTGIVSWWQGSNAGLIDFTKPEAGDWWKARLELLRTTYGIDSFKFDAGETNYLPYSVQLNGDSELQPNLFTTKYVESVASFGGMIEVRVGRRNQNQPIFTRMMDKDSRWGYDNGLQSMIPTLLHFGVLGYPFVLPDMIGGNAYGGFPSGELYIRWMQVNAFMPAVQFSIVPWDTIYGPEVSEITKSVLAIREQYKELILDAANQAVADGSPINRPMWWLDPEDPVTYTIDSQYTLGDSIIVAPVLVEGAVERDIYLPRGGWEGKDGMTYEGPIWLLSYPTPLNTLPFFLKLNNSMYK